MSVKRIFTCDACAASADSEGLRTPTGWLSMEMTRVQTVVLHACSDKCAAALLRQQAHVLDPVQSPLPVPVLPKKIPMSPDETYDWSHK